MNCNSVFALSKKSTEMILTQMLFAFLFFFFLFSIWTQPKITIQTKAKSCWETEQPPLAQKRWPGGYCSEEAPAGRHR